MNTEKKSLSKSERRLFWLSGGAIAFLAAFTGIWQWLNADPVVNIPIRKMPKPNGFDYYLRAGQAFVPDTKGVDETTDPTGRYNKVPRPRSPQQLRQMYPLAAKESWLGGNTKALQLLRQGLRYPSHPPHEPNGEIPFGYYKNARNLARALSVESHLKAERGDWRGAASSTLDCIAFGYEIQRGGQLIAGLVGTAVHAIGLRELRSTLPHLDAATARQAVTRMEHLHAGRFPYSKTMEEEKLFGQRSLLKMMKGWNWRMAMMRAFAPSGGNVSPLANPHMFIISKREMMDNYTRVMDTYIANGWLPYTKRKPIPAPSNAYTASVIPVFERSRWSWARMETSHLLVMTMLGLHSFKLEKGRYPAKLEEPVPKYLKQVPADPYGGGEPLRYKLQNQKYTLWSIGPDGVDNQGKPIVDPTKKADRSRHLVHPDSKGDVVADVNNP